MIKMWHIYSVEYLTAKGSEKLIMYCNISESEKKQDITDLGIAI